PQRTMRARCIIVSVVLRGGPPIVMGRMRDLSLPVVRRAVTLRGTVQGVGLRPALYRLAGAHELAGFVRNDLAGVRLEIEGAPDAISAFLTRLPGALSDSTPPGALIVTFD